MEKDDPFLTFDWVFTDTSHKDAARFHALEARPTETTVLQELISADSIVNFALWSELPRNHPVSELWLETQTDLLASIYLAYGGFFRQALTILRAWFEIAVHGVFFSAHYGHPTGRYERWRKGQRNASAKTNDLAEALAARHDKLIPVDRVTIFEKINPVYAFLSHQTHAQGLDIYDFQEGRDNVPRYLPKSYDIWFSHVLSAFDAVCFLYRLFFSPRIADYFRKSASELQRARELAGSLSASVPELQALISDALRHL
ncbi:MAG TPA: hypothetical protein VGI41_00465 [Candidatus Udaeobacter sp.]|jgi:hypothetical protein